MDSTDYLILLSAVFASRALSDAACLIIAFLFFVMALGVIRANRKPNAKVTSEPPNDQHT